MKEIWKDIPGYEGLFEVSNMGRFKNKRKGTYRKLTRTRGGYNLCLYANKKQRSHYAHFVVAQVFVPNPLNKPYVMFLDGDCTNIRSDNLKWGAPREGGQNECLVRYDVGIVVGNKTYKNYNEAIKDGGGGRLADALNPNTNTKTWRGKICHYVDRPKPVLIKAMEKKVRNKKTGKVYASMKIATEKTGTCYNTITNHCHNRTKFVSNWEFVEKNA